MGMSPKPSSIPRRARGAHPNAGRSGLSCKGTASPHLVFAGARFSRARLGARPGDCNIEFVFNITTRGRVRTWACGAEWGAAVQPSSATSARPSRQAARMAGECNLEVVLKIKILCGRLFMPRGERRSPSSGRRIVAASVLLRHPRWGHGHLGKSWLRNRTAGNNRISFDTARRDGFAPPRSAQPQKQIG